MALITPVSIVTILFFDQLSKFLIIKYIGLHASYDIIKGIFSITPILNTGGGFGILPNQTQILIFVSVVAILIIGIILYRNVSSIPVALILAGALGNLIDRIRLGAVIDFIDFKIWPVFNIADSSITIGAIILVWAIFFKKKCRNLK